jgi:hypothetical protein
MKILFVAVCLLHVGMSGQSYKSVAYPWCEVVDFSETNIACVMPTGRIVVVPAVAPVLSAPLPDRIEEQGWWPAEINVPGVTTDGPRSDQPLTTGQLIGTYEPMDVPAIQEPRRECIKYGIICATGTTSTCPPCEEYGDVPEWTCAEKSRILETAENGTKWCRKVEQ